MWDTGGALGEKQKGHETAPSLLAGLGVLSGRMARGLAQNSRSCGITSVERLEVSRRGRDCESQARMMGAQARPGMSQALSRPLQSPLRRDAAREGESAAVSQGLAPRRGLAVCLARSSLGSVLGAEPSQALLAPPRAPFFRLALQLGRLTRCQGHSRAARSRTRPLEGN